MTRTMSASERRIATLEREKRDLEHEVIALREQVKRVAGGADALEMESGVNKDLRPFITLRWGAEIAQVSVDTGRQHALRMLECAEAADADAALMRGVREMGWDDELAFSLIGLIREYRGSGGSVSST